MIHLLLLLPLAAATRMHVRELGHLQSSAPEGSQNVKCVVRDRHGWGASVAFPVKSRMECAVSVEWNGKTRLLQDKQFSLAFDVAYDDQENKCLCSVNKQPRVQFRPMCKDGSVCKEQCIEKQDAAKKQCWDSYKRLAAFEPEYLGDSLVWRIGQKFAKTGDFEVINDCPPCEEDCYNATVPSYTESLPGKFRVLLESTIAEKESEGTLNGLLKEIHDMLTEKDHGNLRWSKYDTDGDGLLSIDELQAMYPSVSRTKLERIVNKVDANGNGQIDFEEFSDFQDVMLSKWQLKHDSENATMLHLHCVNTDTGMDGNCLATPEEMFSKLSGCLD